MNQRGFIRLVVFSVIIGSLAGCHTDPNVRKKKYLASGNRYSAEGKYRDAAIQYQNSLKADKNFADAHFALAEAYTHIEAYGAAYREFRRTVELQPDNYAARIDLGNLLLAGGKIDDADKQAQAVLAKQPNNADLHALLSAIALKRGDPVHAQAELQRAIDLAPNRSAFYDDLGLLQMHDSRQNASAESSFRKAITLAPKSVNAKLLLSAYYLSNNRVTDAEQASEQAISTDPKSIPAREGLANVYLREGNEPKAEQVLRQASHDLSDNPSGARLLADYYVASNQYPKARSEFESLIGQYPKSLDLQKAYLRVLLQMKDYNTAESTAKRLMKENSGDPEIAALNGIVLLSKGDTGDAINALQNGAKNFPNDPFMQYWLGVAATDQGDVALAQKSFQRVLVLKPQAIDALDQLEQLAARDGDVNLLSQVAGKAITALPNYAGGYVWRAMVEMQQNSPDKAQADLSTAIRMAPQNPQAYFELGELRFSQRQFPDGVTSLEQALQYDPNMIGALRLLVDYDLYKEQPSAALARVNAQIQKNPKNSGLFDLLTELQIRENQTEQASATAQKAMQINPADAEAVMLFASTAVQRGQTASAIRVWQQWTNSHPNDANAIALLGTLEETNGNEQLAEADYRHSLQLQPQQPVAANNLAYLILKDGGNSDVALSLAQIARRAMPKSTHTADTLAWAYYQKGTYEFARDLLVEALKSDPNSATMQYHLGMVYSRLQDKHDAAIHLKEAISHGRGTPTATEAQEALVKLG